MKRMVKKLPGFTIIYLHNPYQCRKCILLTASHNESCKPGDEFYEDGDGDDTGNFLKPFKPISSDKEDEFSDRDLLDYSYPIVYTPTDDGKKISRKRYFHSDKSIKPLSDYSPNSRKQSKTASKIEKKKSPSKRSDSITREKSGDLGTKVPGKGTLKRKRWFLEKLEHMNDDYEDDDLFEDKDFGRFRDLLGDESDYTDRYDQLKTPVFPFSLTPRETTPSPNSKSLYTYSPSKLNISRRKEAQQYHYRRMKRKKRKDVPEKEEARKSEPHTQSGVESVLKCLEQVADILNVYKNKKGRVSDSDDDPYYSDVLTA